VKGLAVEGQLSEIDTEAHRVRLGLARAPRSVIVSGVGAGAVAAAENCRNQQASALVRGTCEICTLPKTPQRPIRCAHEDLNAHSSIG
jgi:hypothetical protein